MKVTQDDLLDALRQAMTVPASGDAPTVGELAAATGRNVQVVRASLKALLDAGRLEVVTMRRPALDGRMRVVPGYRMKAKAKRAA